MTEQKTTVLEGYFATGDHECFVFDKHEGPGEHRDAYPDGCPDDDECRVYPHALLPEGAAGRRGSWVITVQFERDE